MTFQEAQAEIDRLVAKFGLQPITLVINNRMTSTGGQAIHATREIHIPDWMLACEEALDTVRHETAHFLAWSRHFHHAPHGPEWRRAAIECGAVPEPYYNTAASAASPPSRKLPRLWIGVCGEGCALTRARLTSAMQERQWMCVPHHRTFVWNRNEAYA